MTEEVQTPWHEALRKPFPPDQVSAKPRIWCARCRNSDTKNCSEHRKVRCSGCRQNITEAHLHLDYVGHADTTSRLLEVDPTWSWEPAYHNVPPDVMIAAIASGDLEIVEAVIANAPPLFDEYGGMWMLVTIHDDEGKPWTRLGYGDAEGARGNAAIKEVIGDGIRNAAMRAGVALDLWSKSEAAENRREVQQGEPDETSEAKDSKPRRQRGPSKAQERAAEALKGEKEATVSGPQFFAQRAADLVLDAQVDPSQAAGIIETLRADVYEVARRNRWLEAMVDSPLSGQQDKLVSVINEAKRRIEEVRGSGEPRDA